MAAMSDAQPSKLNLWMDFLATNQVDETSAPLLATRGAAPASILVKSGYAKRAL